MTSMPLCLDIQAAIDPELEGLRQHALEELGLLETLESEGYDCITRMASRLFDVPISAVSLTDRSRQWFKSHVGTAGREIPRAGAPCAEVTRSQQFLNVPDLLTDSRFADCLLAQNGIRFYAGAPLTTRSGHTLGAMCVLDTQPRVITPDQIACLRDFASMVMTHIEFQHEAGRVDATSGLPNRHQLYDRFEDRKRNSPEGSGVLLLIELADLRHINDAVSVLGASYLDTLVRTATTAIRLNLCSGVRLYQVGFGSLVIMLDEEGVALECLAEVVLGCLKAPSVANGTPIVINAVVGAASFRLDQVTPQDALRHAVSAARSAREQEMDYAVYDVASDDAMGRRYHLLTHIRESLEAQSGFQLVYQPRLDLRSGVCSSAEALLRWRHPLLGSVSPGEFIPLVEQTALARPMTQWVIASAFAQIKEWQAKGLNVRISINISARNLEEPDFAERLAITMSDFMIAPEQIELEFTESALIRYQNRVLAQLFAIRALGVELAIDDFGTGYSSFAYLRQLPANIVKLDQSFMRSIADNRKDQLMVRSMIGMAHDVGYRVVAEGVETKEVLDLLAHFGCDEIQGYFIARPLPAASLVAFLRQSPLVKAQAA